MIQLLTDWAERTPDAPAFIEPGGAITYGELLRRLRAGAAWLHGCGVRAGDTVALALDPGFAQTERQLPLYYACFYLGAPVLPLYPGVPPALRRPLAARFAARWLIAGSTDEPPPGCARLDPAQFDPESERWRTAPAPRGSDPARTLRYEFTSGTTGEAKAVAFSGAQYAAIAAVNVRYFGWTAGDRLLPVALWPGKGGARSMTRIHSVGGVLVNVPFPQTRERLAELIEELGVTAVQSAPWQLRRLLGSDDPARARQPLRFFATAGGFVDPGEIRAGRALLTANLHVSYACSETGMIAHLPPADPFDAAPVLVTGIEGQAADDEGHALPAGASGRLRFRAQWFPAAYVGNERATGERFRDGWFYTGDTGAVDATGRVTLRGRSDDTVNCGGVKILPQEIEHELLQHPDIADAAVAGMPDTIMGQVPVAFVVLKRSIAAAAVVEFCNARIERARIPRVFLTVSTVPRNTDGKILHGELQEIYHVWASKQNGVPGG